MSGGHDALFQWVSLILLLISMMAKVHGQPPSMPVMNHSNTLQPSPAPTLLPSMDFSLGIDNGEYDVILDVRTRSEWNSGHIEGATLAESLGAFGSMGHAGAVPSDLAGCELCTIAVYCRSGARARSAIQVLLNNGFQGKLYNGQGTSQWTSAGFPLVTDESVIPPCTLSGPDSCIATTFPSDAPSKNGLPERKQPKQGSKDRFKIERTRPSGTVFSQSGIRGGGQRMLTNNSPQEVDAVII